MPHSDARGHLAQGHGEVGAARRDSGRHGGSACGQGHPLELPLRHGLTVSGSHVPSRPGVWRPA
eukprot:7085772-Alexandrium_andersonii.AAC.1